MDPQKQEALKNLAEIINAPQKIADIIAILHDIAKAQLDTGQLKRAIESAHLELRQGIAQLRNGEDGKDSTVPGPKGDKGDPGESITGPRGPKGNDGSPDTPKQIRDKLETLKGDERLDRSAIKGLDDELKRIDSKSNTSFAISRGQVKAYDLSASLNGVTKTFALPAFWLIIDVKLSSAPVLRPTTDFTSDGNAMTITFTSQIDAATYLAAGQSCIVIYAEA